MFIVFEGIDRSGKTTQIDLLKKYFIENGKSVVVLREPGTSVVGEKIRNILLNDDNYIYPKSELFLYLAARAQYVEEILKPSLNNYDIVISDRYFYSTIAYQGYGRGLDLEFLQTANNFSIDSVLPDYSFYIDISYEESIKRSDGNFDRMEKSGKEFFDKVRDGYKIMVEQNKNFYYINGNSLIDKVFKNILEYINKG